MSKRTWTIDAAHSEVGFSVKHMMFTTVRGRFGQLEGTARMDTGSGKEASVEVSVEAASLDTGVADRDAHLRSGDFFDVENYPTLEFRSSSVEGWFEKPGDTFRILGDLTIRGITREVTLEATYEGTGADPWGGTRTGFSAEARIDRREFGLTWNQTLETGGFLVGHEIKIQLSLQAVLAEEPELASVSG